MARRLVVWIAFALPVAYVGIILAVVVHEIVGHGLTAILFGGEFLRFEVYPDGGGRAWTNGNGRWGRAAVLAGGIAADMLFGVFFLVAGCWKRLGLRTRLVLLIFATTLFHDGLPYGFWGALLKGDRGDISSLLIHLEPAEGLRLALVALFGLLYPVSMFLTGRAIFRRIEDGVGPLSSGVASFLAATMTLLMGIGYAAFDWDTLIEGAGLYPTVTVTGLQAVVGTWLVRTRRFQVERTELSPRSWAIAIPCAWLAMGATLAVTLIWLQDGVALD